jgi:hypothetical protein
MNMGKYLSLRTNLSYFMINNVPKFVDSIFKTNFQKRSPIIQPKHLPFHYNWINVWFGLKLGIILLEVV